MNLFSQNRWIVTNWITVWAVAVCGGPVGLGEEIRFNDHIRPILAEHCLECHGHDPEHREADLRLDIESSAKAQAIVPGEPDESELFLRITSQDSDLRMPPDGSEPLRAEQMALIRDWILAGAPYESHWAYQPIQDAEPPTVDRQGLSEIDRFVAAKLEKRGLSFAPPVSRQQLIRRATFDLIGLPPTWKEVQDFVNDRSPQAFAKVVDRLLASPAYGERWGRHWLDLARYADTHGGAAIGFTKFPFSYTYRDYVIQAFNADLPYDQFIIEQLAADQIGLEENSPKLAALGFLTVGMQYRNPHDTIDDQIDVVTRGLLGLTVACARCHDHKYDAIPTEDYYSLYATLASSRVPNRLPVMGNPEPTEPLLDYQQELARLKISHADMAREQNAVMRGRLRMQVGMYLREIAKGAPKADLSAAFLSFRTDDPRPHVLDRWQDYLETMPDTDPVFGPWIRLSRLESARFAEQCAKIVETMAEENAESWEEQDLRRLGAEPPRWNPRVLNALAEGKPASLLDVADIYGNLFAEVHQQWLRLLTETSLEARVGTKPIPDEDPRHVDVNSPVNRQLRRHLYGPGTPTNMSEELASRLLNRPIHDNVSGRKGAIDNLDLMSPGSPPRAMVLREEQDTGTFHVFHRGNPIDWGQPVTARFLTVLGGDHAQPFSPGKRRLNLAQAVAHPENPLTRRVLVNWVWQHHFGKGLVRTPDDFGTRGRPPTHPRLLDFLATRFLEDGWSLKQLHRRIMLSDVYRQGSIENAAARIKDPENELLWRMPRRRLDLEAMRDAMLAVSGELQATMGGRPFDLLSQPTIPRRTVYALVNRDIVTPLASTFDVANPNACTAQRTETTVPQQTLFALNSDFIQDRAAALADRILSASEDEPKSLNASERDTMHVKQLYRRVFSRDPHAEEVDLALNYMSTHDEKTSRQAWRRLAHVLLAANEFVFVD